MSVYLMNYVITPSVDGSGNLTVALKTMAGANPSSSDPLAFKIGNSWYKVTGALSVTVAAGASTFAAGSDELKTKTVDLFCHIGYNATDGVVLAVSRLPGPRAYSDWNTTATNEKYAKISTITNAQASDVYANIGRISATLSGGAAYTWSISGSGNPISYPFYETDWLIWTPTWTGFTASIPTNIAARYKVRQNDALLYLHPATDGTSNATGMTATMPLTAKTVTNAVWQSYITPIDNGSAGTTPGRGVILSGGSTITFYKDMADAAWTNSGAKGFRGFFVTVEW